MTTTPDRPQQLRCGRFVLTFDQAKIMGVINVTPDSFSDGGLHGSPQMAVEHAHALVAEGAHMLDIGGESTRPGALPVSVAQEIERVLAVVEGVRGIGVPISVDTSKPEVMQEVLRAGADMINDTAGFRASGALEAIAASRAALCIMHMRGEPRTMQIEPRYDDVLTEVSEYLRHRALDAEALGIEHERIVIDPGFGFGKTLEHNLVLLRHLKAIDALGWPVLAGLSRKSMLGKITGREVADRVHASVAAALLAVLNGAKIIRVHDVRATRDALLVYEALYTLRERSDDCGFSFANRLP